MKVSSLRMPLAIAFVLFAMYSGIGVTTSVQPQLSNASDQALQCFSCTTMDIEHIFVSLQDDNWRRRVLDAPFASKTAVCRDLSTRENFVQTNLLVRCENGICGRMRIKEQNGDVQIYRSCIKNYHFELHSNCTKLPTSEDIVSVKMCLCATPLCNTNTGTRFAPQHLILVLVAIIVGAFTF